MAVDAGAGEIGMACLGLQEELCISCAKPVRASPGRLS